MRGRHPLPARSVSLLPAKINQSLLLSARSQDPASEHKQDSARGRVNSAAWSPWEPGSAVPQVRTSWPQQSRMRTPRCGRQQLDLLCHDERPELGGKAFHEVLVGEDRCPVLPPVGVVIKLPEMDDLVDRASVALEIAHELLVMAALVERREAELLVELRRFRHLADI